MQKADLWYAKALRDLEICIDDLLCCERQFDEWEIECLAETIHGGLSAEVHAFEVLVEAIIHGKIHHPITPGVAAEIKQKVKQYIRDSIAETKKQIHALQIGKKTSEKQTRRAIATNKKRAAKRPDYLSAVQRLREDGVDYHPACQIVADYHGVSKRTSRPTRKN